MGTGKTYTALGALEDLPSSKVLISAPKQVLERVWKKKETLSHFNISHHDITFLNYEKVARDKSFTKNRYDVMILDEVHKLKGLKTKTSKRYREVSKYAKYVWGLTGTPVANSYADVYCIFKNTNFNIFDMTYNEFLERYYYVKRIPTHPGSYMTYPLLLGTRKNRVSELMKKIGSVSMFKRMEDCQDLPSKRTEMINIIGMNTKKYKEIEKGIMLFEEEGYIKTLIPLATISKTHQAANGFIYDDDKNVITLNTNSKLKRLKELLDNMLGETDKVIIVYNFKEDLNQIQDLCDNMKYKTTMSVQDFEEDDETQVLFLQFSKGEGLNLQFCNHMIFYTYNWSFVSFDQMCARIYRTGQTKKVVYYIFKAKNTIEDKIWTAIHRKQTTNQFIKGVLHE